MEKRDLWLFTLTHASGFFFLRIISCSAFQLSSLPLFAACEVTLRHLFFFLLFFLSFITKKKYLLFTRLVCEIERSCDYVSKAAAPRHKGNLASMFIKKQEESIILSSLPPPPLLPLILCFFSVVFYPFSDSATVYTSSPRPPLRNHRRTLYINLAMLFVLFFPFI